MKKFIVNEEEKNRILNLHKKLISEQQLGNTRFNTASSAFGSIQLPTLPTVFRPADTSQDPTQQSASQEIEGEVSASFFEENKIGDYSEDLSSAETPDSSGGKAGFRETTLTIEDLKNGRTVSIGVKGDVVGKIQELLIAKGYKDVSKSKERDNMFGSMTKAQVVKFQSENKDDKGDQLKKDGIVGPKTINALLKVPTPNTKGLETAVKGYVPTGVSRTLPSPAKQ
jgi:murein L,D-transpeptidase YcbB/YkuD